MIARMPGVIPAGVVNDSPAATVDILPTVCKLAGVPVPDDRVIDGRDILPLLKDATAPSPHQAIFGMQGSSLACIREGKWKLHVRSPGSSLFYNLTPDQLAHYVDPRGPDGVALLAPFEQAKPTQHPGLTSGDRPKEMMLFDLDADRGEQHDVADQNPDVVQQLLADFRQTEAEVPQFPVPKSDYLFSPPPKGQPRPLMRLIGGQLRYDRIPSSQQSLLANPE
jgi:hypothetical protein